MLGQPAIALWRERGPDGVKDVIKLQVDSCEIIPSGLVEVHIRVKDHAGGKRFAVVYAVN